MQAGLIAFFMLANLYMGRMHNFADDLEVASMSVRILPDHIYVGLYTIISEALNLYPFQVLSNKLHLVCGIWLIVHFYALVHMC